MSQVRVPMARIAFLVYAPRKKRRKDDSFDGYGNVGALVIIDALQRHGFTVGFCSADSAHGYDVVLVSLTSTWDMYAFYAAVCGKWDNRKFVVIAGGAGMQNPTAIRKYVDVAVFGRAEQWFPYFIGDVIDGNHPVHPSAMRPKDPTDVIISQPSGLYPHAIGEWKEEFVGCPLKCKFCHYTFARKKMGEGESYVQETLAGSSSPELTLDGVIGIGKKHGRIRTAIDGFSERLRWVYGKKIENADIVRAINAAGLYGGTTTLIVYNIGAFPTETDTDRAEIVQTISAAEPDGRVIFVLHTTPFRPSLATPMQWEPVSLLPDFSKLRATAFRDDDRVRAVHSFTLETPYSLLSSVVAERASIKTDRLFHAIATNKKLAALRSDHAVRAIAREFDISEYLREYELDQKPYPYIHGIVSDGQLRKIAAKMREDARSSGWKRGKSICL